ncbi:MAG: YlmC/YmxH family sporulation protein [Bacilli bacterium]|nr:YlmC/YmxH family sporulation protein [Bacilli bacterium]MDD4406443.1 YlmC/YmxH family sporulation protein [Bacilli bacterium]
MLMSDLQRKDIVNIINGARLGKIVDIDVTKEGYINSLIVESAKLMRKISYGNEVNITFKQIVTIGSDVILVDLSIK